MNAGVQQPIVISASSQMRCRYEALIFRTFCSSWCHVTKKKWNNWSTATLTEGFLWRFESKIVTSSISGMRSMGMSCKQISMNLLVSLQNCLAINFMRPKYDFVTWRFWAHMANVSARRTRIFDSPQSFRPTMLTHGRPDPPSEFTDIATNNRMSHMRKMSKIRGI